MPYYGYYGIDMYYIVLVLPCVLFAFWAQNKVNSTFNRYSQVQNLRGLTGAQAAEAVLRYNGVSGVRIEYVSGKLTDHFDPRSNVIRLSSAVYSSTSVASIGVAAHGRACGAVRHRLCADQAARGDHPADAVRLDGGDAAADPRPDP